MNEERARREQVGREERRERRERRETAPIPDAQIRKERARRNS